ncbi:hypothetical protein J2M53_10155 [Arthrobacter sp. zg-ZUI100]|uniref:hypothetical protein n=1 Tax=Arthrobacter jiangjiafuii TaxID=2817475 RepID=UPI001AEDE42C|nr:hypothetical protein [Arthrobacter jiangjiafuii]MBP3036613.1 hypothetical protein [Arthrobacter jiangjiafuii]
MTKPERAAASLQAAADAQKRARTDARWFPWACLAMFLIVIPGGTVVPWGWPDTLVVTFSTFVLMLCVVLAMSRMRAAPRGSKTATYLAVGCWVILSTVISTLGRNIESFGLGLVCSAVAATPFLVVAAKFSSQKDASR